jgi:hypothetical protein
MTTINEKQLRQGEIFILEDSECELIISFSSKTTSFIVIFNGICVNATKTFRPMMKKINSISEHWESPKLSTM